MIFTMGYKGCGYNCNEQGILEALPIPHRIMGKFGIGVHLYDSHPSDNEYASSKCEDNSCEGERKIDFQCSLYKYLASMNLFSDVVILTITPPYPL